MIGKSLKYRFDEFGMLLAMQMGFTVFGIILVAVIAAFTRDEPDFDIFRMGSLLAVCIGLFGNVMFGMFSMRSYFNMTVGYSRTRRSFFISDFAVSMIYTLALVLVCYGIYYGEGLLNNWLYPGVPEERILPSNPAVWLVPVVAIAVCVIRSFLGSLVLKFGNAVFWVCWVITMAFCIGSNHIHDIKNGSVLVKFANTMINLLKHVSPVQWAVTGVTVGILCLCSSWIIVRKQQVTA